MIVRHTVAIGLTALTAVAVGGCAKSESKRSQPATATGVQRVVLTGEDRALPRTCGPLRIGRAVVAYLQRVNRGDARASRAFAPELAPGGWYSVAPGPKAPTAAGVTARDRESLAAYLSRRHAHDEQLRLVEIAVRARNGLRLADVEYKLVRRAADLPRSSPTGWNTEGKGAIDCATKRIVVWSMSSVGAGERTARQCSPVRKPHSDDAAACAVGTARR